MDSEHSAASDRERAYIQEVYGSPTKVCTRSLTETLMVLTAILDLTKGGLLAMFGRRGRRTASPSGGGRKYVHSPSVRDALMLNHTAIPQMHNSHLEFSLCTVCGTSGDLMHP